MTIIYPKLPKIIWQKKNYIIAITGTLGAGKSIASEIFADLGAKIFNADYEVHQILKDKDIIIKLVKIFGNQILINEKDTNTLIDVKDIRQKQNLIISRAKLASLIFENEDLRLKLTKIIHPLVKQKYEKCCTNLNTGEILVCDIPLLFESESKFSNIDFIICIDAPYQERLERVIKRNNWTKEEFDKRNKSQWDVSNKIEKSDLLIININTKEKFIESIKNIYQKILEARLTFN